jgi:hypothetical protein
LLKTPTNYQVLNTAGGSYYHFGIETWVLSKFNGIDNVNEVSLQVNIDGLLLFKSSGAQLWATCNTFNFPAICYWSLFWRPKPTSVSE